MVDRKKEKWGKVEERKMGKGGREKDGERS